MKTAQLCPPETNAKWGPGPQPQSKLPGGTGPMGDFDFAQPPHPSATFQASRVLREPLAQHGQLPLGGCRVRRERDVKWCVNSQHAMSRSEGSELRKPGALV